jgi:hypothetical protein
LAEECLHRTMGKVLFFVERLGNFPSAHLTALPKQLHDFELLLAEAVYFHI